MRQFNRATQDQARNVSINQKAANESLGGVLRGGGETPIGGVAAPIAGLAGGALGGSPLGAP